MQLFGPSAARRRLTCMVVHPNTLLAEIPHFFRSQKFTTASVR